MIRRGKQIVYKTTDEVALIKGSSLLVGAALAEVGKSIRPGISTKELDKVAHDFIMDNNAVPGFLNYKGFPYSLCTSVNEAVVHGFPTDKPLDDGDIVSVDCGVLKNGFYGDSAFTFAIGEVKEETVRLMQCTMTSLYKGIEMMQFGRRIGDVSFAIQEHAERKCGFGVVRELVGHGLGRNLHEDPEVPNYGRRGKGVTIKEGLVVAIEPMINAGTAAVGILDDGWTIVTKDGKPSAHYEHVVHVTKEGTDVLSSFDEILLAVEANENLKTIEFLELSATT